MQEIDTLLAAMSNPIAEDAIVITIDEASRAITIPDELIILAAEGDKNINRVQFKMSRYFQDIDLSRFTVQINYESALGNRYRYVVDDMTPRGDLLTFSWLVSEHAAEGKGTVRFSICMKLVIEEKTLKIFNSTIGQAQCVDSIPEEDGNEDNPVNGNPTILDKTTIGDTTLA